MNVPSVIKALLQATGWTQAQLAARLGVNQNDVSRYIRGREPRGGAMEAIRELAVQNGILGDERQRIPVMGQVGAGGEIDVDFEQAPFDGFEQVELPPTATLGASLVTDPVGFRVTGASMYPRYNDGDLLIVEREQPWSVESMIGQEAVVVTYDNHRFVKRIRPGPKRHTYNLESVDPQFPTIEGVRIRWASPVRVILPNVGLRKVAPPRRAKPAARTRAKP